MWTVTKGWVPTFPYRSGYIPPREIIARVGFTVDNPLETEKLREKARKEAEAVYRNDLRPLEEKRQEMANKVAKLILAESFDKVDKAIWAEFVPHRRTRRVQPSQVRRAQSLFHRRHEQRSIRRSSESRLERLREERLASAAHAQNGQQPHDPRFASR